ncbi:hypothetical protein [Levilactobacillus suantsaiihabitans]|uniref:DUF624 domain-containing protein n=1 Tax=Levilactobacillus suantsaiihabitans TaxID=2487722 RepID=A0A4Z0JCF9_9LACO|nr:hypothetical protein [Levilactobacillus suantsaiihabitans]TGD19437.1 hypothetical protein EGT51_04515 [Levilactobacillus suantsaiihabitans]
MSRIFNSRLYLGLIPLTNYLILGVFATMGFATVFFAYPIISACITTAIRIYGQGNETILRKFFEELKRHFWTKLGIGLVTSTMAILFYYVYMKAFTRVIVPIRVSLVISLFLFVAALFYMVLEEYSMRDEFHFSRFFQNAMIDIVIELPMTLAFAAIMFIMILCAMVFPVTIFFSLTFLNFIFASFYHKRLNTKLSRF